MANQKTLTELLQQMKNTADNPGKSTSFNQAYDTYRNKIIEIQTQPTRFRSEIRDAKQFLSTQEIPGMNMQEISEQLEELELAIS